MLVSGDVDRHDYTGYCPASEPSNAAAASSGWSTRASGALARSAASRGVRN